MSSLAVDPERIPGRISAISDKNEELKACYKKILEINDLVRVNWTGDAATSAVNAIDSDSKVLLDLTKLLDDLVQQLTEINNAYIKAEEASTVKAQG